MLIGSRILERMEKVGLSQAELARRVGLSQPTIHNMIHRGKKGSTKLHVIARELKTTPAYLTGETDDPESDAPEETVTSEERAILEHFRNLTPKDRAAARQLIESLSERERSPKPSSTLHAPGRSFAGREQSKGEAA